MSRCLPIGPASPAQPCQLPEPFILSRSSNACTLMLVMHHWICPSTLTCYIIDDHESTRLEDWLLVKAEFKD